VSEPKEKPSAELSELESGVGVVADEQDDDPVVSARPTIAPAFDIDCYARTAMFVSDDDWTPLDQTGEVPTAGVTAAGEATPVEPVAPRAGVSSGAEGARPVSLPPPPPLPAPPPSKRQSMAPQALAVGPGASSPDDGMSALPPTQRSIAHESVPATGRPAEGPVVAEPGASPLPPDEQPTVEPPGGSEASREDASAAADVSARGGDHAPDSLLSIANFRAPRSAPGGVPAVRSEALTPVPSGPISAPLPADPAVEMQEHFALGDYSGALVIAESILDENPTHTAAREYADSCRSVLQEMYTARLGSLDRVPVVAVPRDQLRWLSIDHRTGFILSLVDGVSTIDMILDICGMPALDALRMLFELAQQRVIALRDE
jgi:hypothetical protein